MTEAAQAAAGRRLRQDRLRGGVRGADALVVITEWHEFRGLDPRRIKQVMRQPRIVDLRNIFDPEEMRGLGFAYEGVGRPKPRT